MDPARLALVGCGGWGHEMSKRLMPSDLIQPVACFDPNGEAAADFAKRSGAKVADSYEAILTDEAVEGVIFITPTFTHAELGSAAAAAGKHVFVDKPIENCVADGRRLVEACRQAGVWLAVGHSQRRRGELRKMKALIEDGTVGRPIQAEGNFSHSGGMRLTEQMWRWHKAKCPGGPLNLLGVHVADNMVYLLGPPVEVTALHGKGASPAEMDDVWCSAVRFKSGVLASINANYCTPGIGYVNVYGTGGNLLMNRGEPLILQRDGHGFEKVDFEKVDPERVELEDFAQAIRDNRPPEVTGEDGLVSLSIVEAAVRSSYEGRPVKIAEVMGD